jgi:hypothetical protein
MGVQGKKCGLWKTVLLIDTICHFLGMQQLSIIHQTAKACYWTSIKCFQEFIHKAPTTKSHMLNRLIQDVKLKNNVLNFTVAGDNSCSQQL